MDEEKLSSAADHAAGLKQWVAMLVAPKKMKTMGQNRGTKYFSK